MVSHVLGALLGGGLVSAGFTFLAPPFQSPRVKVFAVLEVVGFMFFRGGPIGWGHAKFK